MAAQRVAKKVPSGREVQDAIAAGTLKPMDVTTYRWGAGGGSKGTQIYRKKWTRIRPGLYVRLLGEYEVDVEECVPYESCPPGDRGWFSRWTPIAFLCSLDHDGRSDDPAPTFKEAKADVERWLTDKKVDDPWVPNPNPEIRKALPNPIVYHGTYNFGARYSSAAAAGRDTLGDYGPGEYFATNEVDAESYGSDVSKYNVTVTKPLKIAPGEPTKAEIAKIQRGLRLTDEYLGFDDGTHPIARMMTLIKDVGYRPESVRKFLEKLGYDSIFVANSEVRKQLPEARGDYWIVFDPGNIQAIEEQPVRKPPKRKRKSNPGPSATDLVRKLKF
jgi:hypothetical protein